jgi:ACR3 family arsenite transporter
MFFLAVTMLADRPEAMAGLILIGLARCIAMVIVWNDLAGGSRTYAALLVALNSVFQLLAYGFYAWLFVEWLPGTMGMISQPVEVPMGAVASSVLLYLGVPFLAGYLGRFFLVKKKGIDWYNRVYLPKVSPLTLYALLFTIVLMFCLKGDSIVQLPGEVLRVALPLLIYFLSMFVVSFLVCRALGLSYEKNTAISFTATGNNFELAIAVGIAVYGLGSQQAFVGVVGPLVEVPAMILLVRLGRSLQGLLYRS